MKAVRWDSTGKDIVARIGNGFNLSILIDICINQLATRNK